VLALAQDGQGRLWIGTSKGVTYVDGAANSGGDNTGILADEPVLCLATGPANDIWLATRSGLDVVRNGRTRERLLDDVVYAIAFDPSGMPWVCTESGEIKKRSDAGWQMVARIVALALSPARRMVVGRDGSIWLATTAGLGVWSAEGQFSLLKAEGLPEGEVRGLALGQDGALWVATARGLSRRSPSGQWGVLTTASTQGGLRSAEIRDVLLDREGTLWVSTAAGISVRSAKADWSYLDLPGVRSVWPEPSGIVWLGTSGGLYRLQRDALMAVP
jgi:ligand-binding sensor domain-containing protein